MSVSKHKAPPLPQVDTAAHKQSLSEAVGSVEDARVGALQQLAAVRAAKNVNLQAERDFYAETFGADSSTVKTLDQRIATNKSYASAYTTGAQKATASPQAAPKQHIVHGTLHKKGVPVRGYTVRLYYKHTLIEDAEYTASDEHGYYRTVLHADHLKPHLDAKTEIAEEGAMVAGLALTLAVHDADGHVVDKPAEEVTPEAGGLDLLTLALGERAKAPSKGK
jgi:hypothetical protein